MNNTEQVYIRLQRHLDKQAVGFPATRSKSEIRLLEQMFSPEDAELAQCLTYKFEPLEVIFKRAGDLVESKEELAQKLDHIEFNGGIELKGHGENKEYCIVPLVVGMFEFQLGRMDENYVKHFNKYVNGKKFGIDFVSTELPQMRTIPVAKSIQPQHNISTYDEVAVLLQEAEAPFAVFECVCRNKKVIEGKPCKTTDRDTCFAAGSLAEAVLRRGLGREITMEETVAFFEQNQKDGLVLQPSNSEKIDFICSCCECCCGILNMQRILPKPVDFWASNFYAKVDTTACNGCGNCQKRCNVTAVIVAEKKQPAVVDLKRCIGCGICVPTCPKKAITLQKKSVEVRPLLNREELYETIMEKKKGNLGKLKVLGKLVIDAIKTGQPHLIK